MYTMSACTALSRLREIQGRPAEAAAFLAQLEEAWPDIGFFTQGVQILQSLRADPGRRAEHAAEAAAWCRDFTPVVEGGQFLPGMGPFGAAEVYYRASLAWARLQILLGKPQAVLAYLERQLAAARTNGLAGRAVELSLLEALAAQAAASAQGRGEQRVWTALERALAAAEPEGYIRTLDQGPELARLLVEAARGGLHPEYTGRVLAAISAPKPASLSEETRAGSAGTAARATARTAAPTILEGGETLSEREREVLRLMAEGATNQAIADRLVITVGTVKSHINHILGKLDAHNRTEAVARARLLGLLEI
jgi:DNA-binding NarL/FixJ family response regulator